MLPCLATVCFYFFLPPLYTKRGSSHPTDRVQTDPPTVNEGIKGLEALYVTRTPAETFVRSHGGGKGVGGSV